MIFLIGAILLTCTRATLAQTSNRTQLLFMSAVYGYVRAATVVNQNLTISEYTTEDKLAGALGLNMVTKGLLVITVGQVLGTLRAQNFKIRIAKIFEMNCENIFAGWIRDYSGSYPVCLHAQNVLLIIVILMWTPEVLYRRYKASKHSK